MLLRSAPLSCAIPFRNSGAPTRRCFLRPPWRAVPPLARIGRASSSSANATNEKPYYVTSPIFYVNAAPHVGHLYSMVLADVLKRWQQLKGNRAILCTGTDEHGMKIQRAADKAGSDPAPFCDNAAEVFQSLAAKASLSEHHFVRTTEPAHRDAVQYAWSVLQDQGHIYLSKHEGWYSVSDETFYPESGVHLIVDPPTGRKIMASIETGKEVEWTSETNYKFRLSAFKDALLELYKNNPKFLVPKSRMDSQLVKAVSEGLEDLSVSRPSSRLTWGIPVPGDDSQTIYVWLDALVNYITKAGYPWAPGQESDGGWPANVHVVGKDIVRFHAVYWPAFLMALGLPPPRQILSHAHWTLGNEKMAKSTGNVVNPFFAMDRFGTEVMRFYLSYRGGIKNDSDYSNENIVTTYEKALQRSMGNLTSRITRGKRWSLRKAVERVTTGRVALHGDLYDAQHKRLARLPHHFERSMEDLDIASAIGEATTCIYGTNVFISDASPWTLVNDMTQDSLDKVDAAIYLSAECLRLCGILLQPVMPEKMSQLLDMLGVLPERRTFSWAQVDKDDLYGTSMVELGAGRMGTLFPPLPSSESPL